MQTPANYKKYLADKAYREKHNYMAIPGEHMPEYSGEELTLVEMHCEVTSKKERKNKSILVRQIAKKCSRSYAGVSNKIYRLGSTYVSPTQRKRRAYHKMLELKAAGQWDYTYNCPKSHLKYMHALHA